MSIELPPCQYEDSTDCWWDANSMGNQSGTSFISIADVIHPVELSPNTFISGAQLHEDGTFTVTTGAYWVEEPTPTDPPAPVEPAPAPEPAPVPPTFPAPMKTDPTPSTPVNTATETVTQQPIDTLPATGMDDLNPITLAVGIICIVAGAMLATRRRRHQN